MPQVCQRPPNPHPKPQPSPIPRAHPPRSWTRGGFYRPDVAFVGHHISKIVRVGRLCALGRSTLIRPPTPGVRVGAAGRQGHLGRRPGQAGDRDFRPGGHRARSRTAPRNGLVKPARLAERARPRPASGLAEHPAKTARPRGTPGQDRAASRNTRPRPPRPRGTARPEPARPRGTPGQDRRGPAERPGQAGRAEGLVRAGRSGGTTGPHCRCTCTGPAARCRRSTRPARPGTCRCCG